jgi:malonyl-CoA decarboxylase
MRSGMVNQIWTSIADAGRDLLRGRVSARRRGIEALCRDLLSTRGEASGAALAREVVETLRAMPDAERLAFFELLAQGFEVDHERLVAAAEAYKGEPALDTLLALRRATEAPRLELFRRMNMAPNGTRAIVRLREQLLRELPAHPELKPVDADLHALLTSWFNPGFLSLARIDWNSPASLLEKFLRYERVHRMRYLEDMKRRLAADRRCFAFFHPALPGEPLIFVEVALVKGIAEAVQPLLARDDPPNSPQEADTAIFYSISNCQEGLRGISFGNFLIKQVVEELKAELPQLIRFSTLSPVPGFRRWLERHLASPPEGGLFRPEEAAALGGGDPAEGFRTMTEGEWWLDEARREALRAPLLRLAAVYLTRPNSHGASIDPVARFHLGNGARLERINPLGNVSARGMRESYGIMVNYLYDRETIEANHEAFVRSGQVARSAAVDGLLQLPRLAPAAPSRSALARLLGGEEKPGGGKPG